ncbi:unnamed protein product [Cuscuta epithymum]|uniref:Glycine-rich protein n=1 Tax=Cuscuta epithymum TaxID=186058 RepID=A0AAV0F1M2_9ASTE|nr:unnamed protein product [Cuscuta epithymum]
MASPKLCVTLFLLATAVSAACAARSMPATGSENAFNDQKNFVSYGGVGGMSGIGSNGLPFGGFASGAGANGDFGSGLGGGGGLGGGFGGGSGIGGGSSLPTIGGAGAGIGGGSSLPTLGAGAGDLPLP